MTMESGMIRMMNSWRLMNSTFRPMFFGIFLLPCLSAIPGSTLATAATTPCEQLKTSDPRKLRAEVLINFVCGGRALELELFASNGNSLPAPAESLIKNLQMTPRLGVSFFFLLNNGKRRVSSAKIMRIENSIGLACLKSLSRDATRSKFRSRKISESNLKSSVPSFREYGEDVENIDVVQVAPGKASIVLYFADDILVQIGADCMFPRATD
jgi:hypothetical protein